MTFRRNQAAFAPNLLLGGIPAASSFFVTSWVNSIVPAFSQCHRTKSAALICQRLLTTARYFGTSENKEAWQGLIRRAT